MSYQHTANNLASQGRNGDTTLMHVSPREVAGLQALAQQHGRSLTINPETGMPEAFSLSDLLPVAAGFALDAFVPGAGQAVGGMLGLGQAAGTAAIVGGLAGLSSGSLEDGLKWGLGAYSGAGLSQGVTSAGTNAAVRNAENAVPGGGALTPEAAKQAASGASFSDSMSAIAANPVDFLKENKWALGAAALPALMGTSAQGGAEPLKNKGYIRRYAQNPTTGALEQAEAVPVDDWGDRPAVSFGGVAPRTGYADGGVTGSRLVYNPLTKKYDTVSGSSIGAGPVKFGGVAERAPVVRDPNDTRTDSQKAYDYLMGVPGARNPMLPAPTKGPEAVPAPLDLETRTGGHYVMNQSGTGYDWVPDTVAPADEGLAALAENQRQRGGGNDAGQPGGGWGAMSVPEKAAFFGQNPGWASLHQKMLNVVPFSSEAKTNEQAALNLANSTAQATADANPNAFGGGYTGVGGTTSPAGAMLAANPMGRDPATVQGQGMSAAPAGDGLGGGISGPSGVSAGVGEAGRGAMSASGGGGGADAGGGGVATGGQGGDASGGGDRGTRGGFADGGLMALAAGGLGSLGGYSDGGRLLRGPGDGVSDSIPATIGKGQPARLADGEFVVPARIVSELGNGSTEAGAKQLYAMLARIQAGRAKTTGKNQVAKNSKAARHLPA